MNTTKSTISTNNTDLSIYDVIVIGLGGSGISTLYYLAKAGYKVLGLEKFDIPHKNGSSHGDSRIIRQCYYEGVEYVPFVLEAYKLWEELEKESGEVLFNKTGCISFGNSKSNPIIGMQKSASVYNLPVKNYTSEEINKRFPLFKVKEDICGVYEDNGGVLNPDKCVNAYYQLVKRINNAEIRTNTDVSKVLKSKLGSDYNYEVVTAAMGMDTRVYKSKKVIISAGSYLNTLLEASFNYTLPLEIERQLVTYCKYKDGRTHKNIPVYVGDINNTEFYGFPDLGVGFKFAFHHKGRKTKRVEEVDRNIREEERDAIFDFFPNVFSDFSKDTIDVVKEETCLYTNSPDKDFIIDYLNNDENLICISACSGHGFKFTSAVGKYIHDMIVNKRFIEFFSLKRFKGMKGSPKF